MMDTNPELLEPVNADLYRRRVHNGELRKLSGVGFTRKKETLLEDIIFHTSKPVEWIGQNIVSTTKMERKDLIVQRKVGINNSQPEQQLSEDAQKLLSARFDEEHKLKTSPYSLRNIIWLVAAMAVFYYSDFYLALRYDPRINRTWLNIGLMLIAVNVGIALFLILWISCVKKIHSDEWEQHYPAAIPVATGAFIIGAFCLTIGLWPVWSILTPLILFVLFMGFVVVVAMLPNF